MAYTSYDGGLNPWALSDAAPWTPESEASLRAWWSRGGKRNGIDDPLANLEDLASWVDQTGSYPLNVVGGTAPTGATSAGGPVVLAPAAAGCIGSTPGALPDDVAGTIGAVVRAPSINLSARDFDAVLCFSESSSANKQLLCCLRRISTQLRFGFASQNGGSYSAWHGNTVLATNTWYRVVWVFTGTGMQIFVNGTEQTITNDVVGGTSVGQWLSVVTAADTVTLCGRRWSGPTYAELWENHYDQAVWFSAPLAGGALADLDAWLAARQAEVD